jgi:hypothetical protein
MCRRDFGQLTGAARRADGSIVSVPKDQAFSLARLLSSRCWFQTDAVPVRKVCKSCQGDTRAEHPCSHFNALFYMMMLQERPASVGRYVAARVG